MRVVRRTLLALMVGLVLLFVFGRPMAWSEAMLVMWDVAADGALTWLQDVTAPPREYPMQ